MYNAFLRTVLLLYKTWKNSSTERTTRNISLHAIGSNYFEEKCYVSINLQNYMLLLTNHKLNLKNIYCYRIQLQDQGVSSSEQNASEHLDNRYLQ